MLRGLHADGWRVVRVKGSHHQLKHPTKPGTVTVKRPAKDYPAGALKRIERQSGVSMN
ncbi:MAG: type II toxin-antitoxin system HicA family toxin [Gemmatimonadaceae bacterium]